MFCIGLYETDKSRRGSMRERIVRYAMQADIEVSVLYITGEALPADIGKYAKQMQIALLSMDSPEYLELGKNIYRGNPECRICFYKSEKCDLEPVLEARPIGFYRLRERPEAQGDHRTGTADNPFFGDKLDSFVKDILAAGGAFRYETRKNAFFLPLQDILYFQSDLKYVDIHLRENPDQRIYGRLTDIEQALEKDGLSNRFIRIHKSYLVNIRHIVLLDKVNHTVALISGEQLPVSGAQYAMVQQVLSRLFKE